MRTRYLTVGFVYLLLSSMFQLGVYACGCSGSPPGSCYTCQGGVWVQYGDCQYGCYDCTPCVGCWCTYNCPFPQDCTYCINNSCHCAEVSFEVLYPNHHVYTCVGGQAFTTSKPSSFYPLPYPDGYWPWCCDYLIWDAPGGDPAHWEGGCLSTYYNTPGEYTVTARLSCGSSDTLQVTAIEVASLLPDIGEEFDDGDGDPNTKSFAVCSAPTGVVTVTATPNPNVSEEILLGCGCWTLEGGTGTSLLFRTVDRTTPGVTTITCCCGPSSKTTKIYVGNPITVPSSIKFIKSTPQGPKTYMDIEVWLRYAYYYTELVCWDSCYTSKGRKFNHLHATNDFPFTVYVDLDGDGNPDTVSVSASESDAYWDTRYYGYERTSSATFSQNCHGYAQGKSYWIDDNPIVIEDDYVTTTGMDGEFEYNPGADHSIKILFFYPWGYLSTTSEKMHHSGVYARTFLPPGLIPATMYKKK